MIFDPTNLDSRMSAKLEFMKLMKSAKPFEMKQKNITRTTKQNRALHLYFSFVAEELNTLGINFKYEGLKGLELSTPYTEILVKEVLWKPIQRSLFDIDSTTKLTTKQMNDIIDVITLFFGEKGINLEFPNLENLMK